MVLNRKTLFILNFFLTLTGIKAQNLILNGGFEKHIDCPFFYTRVHENIPSLSEWNSYNDATPDYFNSCSRFVGVPKNFVGYQQAYQGEAYAGFIACERKKRKYREVLAGRLKKKLKKNELYYVGFQVSLADNNNIGTNHLHAYFNNGTSLRKIGNITDSLVVQDTSGWTTLKSFFYANGNEEFIYIGNLEPMDSLRFSRKWDKTPEFSYYYLDNVYLVEIPKNLALEISHNDSIVFINKKIPFNTFHETITYDFDSLKISSGKNELKNMLALLTKNPFLELSIQSQMDSTDNKHLKEIIESSCQNISEERIKYEFSEDKTGLSKTITFTITTHFDYALYDKSLKKQ